MFIAGSVRDTWKLQQRTEHDFECPIFVQNHPSLRKFGRHSYQAKHFVPLIIERIRNNLSLKKSELHLLIKKYINVAPTDSFVKRVRNYALQQYIGSEVNYLRSIECYMSKLNSYGHSSKLLTVGKEEMVSIALRCEKAQIDNMNKHMHQSLL